MPQIFSDYIIFVNKYTIYSIKSKIKALYNALLAPKMKERFHVNYLFDICFIISMIALLISNCLESNSLLLDSNVGIETVKV